MKYILASVKSVYLCPDIRGVRSHLVLACGCGSEPEDNWRADRRCWTLCRRPVGRARQGRCHWCRTAAGSCSSVSEERNTQDEKKSQVSQLCYLHSFGPSDSVI